MAGPETKSLHGSIISNAVESAAWVSSHDATTRNRIFTVDDNAFAGMAVILRLRLRRVQREHTGRRNRGRRRFCLRIKSEARIPNLLIDRIDALGSVGVPRPFGSVTTRFKRT
jgi:hypothetical protein